MRIVWERNHGSQSRSSETESLGSSESGMARVSVTAPVSKNVTPQARSAPLTAPSSANPTPIYPLLGPDRQISQSREPLLPPIYPTLDTQPFPSRRQSSTSTPRVTIPFDLPSTFSTIAKPNTSKGIETCGILLGFQQSSDSFLITSLLIPNQTGTHDTCETVGCAEERILSYALTNELVCLGWIHTHPTQSCFLSSVDMHTTLSYQRMLPNAIAIVVAPTDRSLPVGVWRLTEFGIIEIGRCKLGGFHDHQGKEAFSTLVDEVTWDTSLKVVVVDQRDR
jgi:STAM-binding protein